MTAPRHQLESAMKPLPKTGVILFRTPARKLNGWRCAANALAYVFGTWMCVDASGLQSRSAPKQANPNVSRARAGGRPLGFSLARFRPAHYHSQVEFAARARDGRGADIGVGRTGAVAAVAASLADARRILVVSCGAERRSRWFCRSGGLARQRVRAGFRGAGIGGRGVLPRPRPARGRERRDHHTDAHGAGSDPHGSGEDGAAVSSVLGADASAAGTLARLAEPSAVALAWARSGDRRVFERGGARRSRATPVGAAGRCEAPGAVRDRMT